MYTRKFNSKINGRYEVQPYSIWFHFDTCHIITALYEQGDHDLPSNYCDYALMSVRDTKEPTVV